MPITEHHSGFSSCAARCFESRPKAEPPETSQEQSMAPQQGMYTSYDSRKVKNLQITWDKWAALKWDLWSVNSQWSGSSTAVQPCLACNDRNTVFPIDCSRLSKLKWTDWLVVTGQSKRAEGSLGRSLISISDPVFARLTYFTQVNLPVKEKRVIWRTQKCQTEKWEKYT